MSPERAAPLAFEPNVGQADPAARFVARLADGGLLFVGPARLALAIPDADGASPIDDPLARLRGPAPGPRAGTLVHAVLDGADPDAEAVALAPLPGVSHYLRGSDPADWATHVPRFARVELRDVYPGVTLALHGEAGVAEYDFVVAPGADASLPRLRFPGADEVRLHEDGSLVVQVGDVAVRHTPPVSWQEGPLGREGVASAFEVAPDGTVSFRVGAHDATRALVIDPLMLVGSYIGGRVDDVSYGALDVDALGNAYLGGLTTSSNFPVFNAFQPTYVSGWDGFAMKLSPLGQIVYSTFLSGKQAFRMTAVRAVAADSNGNAFLAGHTNDPTFPTLHATQPVASYNEEAFVTVLAPLGNALVFSTFLGGTSYDAAYGIDVAPDGSAFAVTGPTYSTWDFPTRASFQGPSSGFVTYYRSGPGAASPSPTVAFSSYVGAPWGTTPASLAMDATGAVVIAGATLPGLPVRRAFQPAPGSASPSSFDGFVARVTAAGALDVSSYLGGSAIDAAYMATVSSKGDVYVVGFTMSPNFPGFGTSFRGFVDGFLLGLNGDASVVQRVVQIGMAGNDGAWAVASDADSGSPIVAGYTTSPDFPQHATNTVLPGDTAPFAGGADAFVMRIDNREGNNHARLYGGNGLDAATGVGSDALGNTVLVGSTGSTNLPTTPWGVSATRHGGGEIFHARFALR